MVNYLAVAVIALILFNSYRRISLLRKNNDALNKAFKANATELVKTIRDNHVLRVKLSTLEAKYALENGEIK